MTSSESLAEKHLLRLIRQHDQDGWAQFVQRFQGRMIAFAKSQIGNSNDAEDLVQESFVGFLRTLDSYPSHLSLESWLFRILRRRIIDAYRAKGSKREFTCCVLAGAEDSSLGEDPLRLATADDPSPSVYVRQVEQQHQDQQILSQSLHQVVDQLKSAKNLRDLMILEGLFYAGIRNRDLSEILSIDEKQIALIRHRLLARLRQSVQSVSLDDPSDLAISTANPLRTIWERDRPSCPKRTTLGKAQLEILDPVWQEYVTFHVDRLGCQFCRANWQDLESGEDEVRTERIFQSTIGFARHSE